MFHPFLTFVDPSQAFSVLASSLSPWRQFFFFFDTEKDKDISSLLDADCLLHSVCCVLQIDEKQNQLSAARKQLKAAKADHKASHDDKSKK